ncbi:membrane protein [Catellatospora methionotrophica]|uniref:Membrane protein n=1 Tax=Catellatospora methionotrophica TaxID=121620 RepID=A0A8J3L9S7_9ACTN|nr:Uma2 family endonuclease [Catellatospora methionotrophica]GIG14248.1 membrane protein [Catellatospora methionotrophica]
MTHPLLRSEPLRAWQFEDLRDSPDDGYRYEIFDGTLLVTPPPPMPHFTTLYRLRRALEAQAPSDFVVGENLGVLRRDGTSYFIPDLVIFDVDLLGGSMAALPPAAAQLVVEVVSPSNPSNDLVLKRAGYAMVGVAEYWIVEPGAREILVLTQPGPAGYDVEEKHTGMMSGAMPFPYQLDLAKIFA